MKKISVTIFLAFLTYSSSSCSGNGKSIGAPALEPPVEATKPSGMASSTTELTCPDCEAPLETLKGRLFSPGETDFQYRLQMVDSRMAELNKRSEESENEIECLSAEPVEWTPPAMPEGVSFPMYFTCHEVLSEYSQLAFGFYEDDFYLVELQKAGGQGPAIGVLAKTNSAGTNLEVWQILNDDDDGERFSVMHILANSETEDFEVSVGGTAYGTGVSCGVQMKSNPELIYAEGIFAVDREEGGNAGCTEDDENFPYTQLCASATDLSESDDLTGCTDSSLDEFTTENHGNGSTFTYEEAMSLINAEITGVPTFE